MKCLSYSQKTMYIYCFCFANRGTQNVTAILLCFLHTLVYPFLATMTFANTQKKSLWPNKHFEPYFSKNSKWTKAFLLAVKCEMRSQNLKWSLILCYPNWNLHTPFLLLHDSLPKAHRNRDSVFQVCVFQSMLCSILHSIPEML